MKEPPLLESVAANFIAASERETGLEPATSSLEG